MIFFVTLLFSLSWISRAGADCNSYIISTKTSDVVLTASSEYASSNKTYDYSASRGVINTTEFTTQNGVVYMGAWTAATDDDKQYIQIQLKKDYLITGVVTQGRNGCCKQWVTKYRVFYGDDCNHLKVLDGGKGTGFQGNSDENTMVTNKLPFPVTARCIRIAPSKWHNKVSMRVDLLGCLHQTTVSPSGNGSTTAPMTSTTIAQQTVFLPGVCSVNLLSANTTLTSQITASNTKVNSSMLVSYLPEKAILYAQEETSISQTRFMGGWSPQVSDLNQWIQVEFSEPAIIRGVVTQGKNGCCRKWVTKYKVSYSADCKTWNVSGGGSGQIFKANTDTDTPVPNIIICPTVVKCIRILPMEWNNEIAMRIEMIGCPIKDGGSTLANQVTVSTTATNPMSSPSTTTTVTSLMTSGTTVPTTTSVIVNTQQTTGVNQCNTYLFSHQPYQGNITLSASSERSHFDKTNDYSANRGRLHSTETMGFGVQLHGGWSAAFKDSNQYIKVELPSIATISGIVTQGKDGSDKEWVTKYRVLYSEDCKRWSVVIGPTGSAFNGNKDTDTEVANMFTQPIQAKCIKINPEAWNNHISLRMDLIGCFRVATQQLSVPVTQPTTTPTTTTKQTTTLQTTSIPTTTTPTTSQGPLCHGSLINNYTIGSLVNLTASSQFHNPASGTDPTRALLDTKTEHINAYTLLGGWSPTKDDGKQYIQATFASPHLVDSVITQGLDNTQQWVTKYKIEYSEDCVHYQQLQHPKEFTANTDYDAKVTNKLGCPVFVKCVRLYPTEWSKHSGLRFDLIGCEIIDTHSNSSVFWSTTNTVLSTTTTTSTSPSTSTATTSTSPSTSTATTSTSPRTSTTSISTSPSISTITSTSSIASTSTTTTTSPSTLTAQNTTTSNSQSTTTTPVMTHITHKIFPTGKASNYDKRDPLDCKRALIIDPCTDPIVKKHCFYSCNKKLGTSSSLTTSVSQTSIHSNTVSMSSQNMLSASTVALSQSISTMQSSSIMATTAISHSSTNTIQSMPVISSSLSLPMQSSALSSKMSALDTSSSVVQNSQLTTMPLSSSPQFSSTSNIKASSALIAQHTVTMSGTQLTTPSSSVSTSSSITVTPPVSHITHIVLPTGQASIYNPLDPLDCKRSLLIAPCSVPIVAKHCPHSCSKPTTNSVQSSSTINPPSSTDKSTMSPNSVNIIPSSSLSQTPGMNPGSSNIHPFHSTNLQQTSIFVQGSSNINPSPSTSFTQATNMIPASSNINHSPSTNIIQTTSILPDSSNMNPSPSTNLFQTASILPGSSNTNPSSSTNLLQTSSILPGSSNAYPSSSINLFQTSSILPGSSSINSLPSKNMLQTSSVQGSSNINPSSSTNLLQTSSILPGSSNTTPSSSAHLFPTSIILSGSSNINQAPSTNLLQTSIILPVSSNITPSSSAHLFQTSSILPGSSNINFSPSINLLQTSSDKGSSNINQASSTSMSQTSSIQPGSSNSQSLGHLINPSSAVFHGSIPSTVVSSFDIQSSGSLQGFSFAGSMSQSYGSSHSTLLAFSSQNSISSMQKFSTNVMLSSTMNPLVTISVSNFVYQSPMTSNMITQLNSIAPRMNVASSALSSLSKSSNPPSTTIPMSITNSIVSTVPFGSSTIQVLSSNIPIASGIPSVSVSSSDNIMSSSGVLISSSDNIMSSSGVPMSSSDNIMSSSGVPMSSSDNIMSSTGVPISSSDNIMSSSGAPVLSTGIPSLLPSVHMSSANNPMSSSGVPVLSSGIPSVLPSVPVSSSDNLVSSSGVLMLSNSISSVLPSVPVTSFDSLVSTGGIPMFSTVSMYSSVLPSSSISVVTVFSSNAPLSSSGVHIPSSDISSSHHATMSSGIMMPPSSVAMSSGVPILTSPAPLSSSVQMTSGVETSSLSNSVLSTADMSSALQISPSSTSVTPNIQITDSISSSVVSMLSSSVSMSITCAPMSSSDMTMSTSHMLTPSTSIPVTIRSSALSYSSLIMTPSSYMSHYSDVMSYSGLASSYVSSVGMFVSSGVPMTCYNVPITITPVLPLSLSSMYSTATPSSTLFGSTISPVTSTILQTASTNMATMSQKVSSSSIKTTSQSPATTTPTTLTTPTTPVTTPPRPSTTVTHITHITIPTGVASIYDKRDPVDCKRSLKAFKCTVPIIAMHCHFSCKTQAGRRKRGILTGSSTRSDKKMMLFGSSFQSSKKSNSDMNII